MHKEGMDRHDEHDDGDIGDDEQEDEDQEEDEDEEDEGQDEDEEDEGDLDEDEDEEEEAVRAAEAEEEAALLALAAMAEDEEAAAAAAAATAAATAAAEPGMEGAAVEAEAGEAAPPSALAATGVSAGGTTTSAAVERDAPARSHAPGPGEGTTEPAGEERSKRHPAPGSLLADRSAELQCGAEPRAGAGAPLLARRGPGATEPPAGLPDQALEQQGDAASDSARGLPSATGAAASDAAARCDAAVGNAAASASTPSNAADVDNKRSSPGRLGDRRLCSLESQAASAEPPLSGSGRAADSGQLVSPVRPRPAVALDDCSAVCGSVRWSMALAAGSAGAALLALSGLKPPVPEADGRPQECSSTAAGPVPREAAGPSTSEPPATSTGRSLGTQALAGAPVPPAAPASHPAAPRVSDAAASGDSSSRPALARGPGSQSGEADARSNGAASPSQSSALLLSDQEGSAGTAGRLSLVGGTLDSSAVGRGRAVKPGARSAAILPRAVASEAADVADGDGSEDGSDASAVQRRSKKARTAGESAHGRATSADDTIPQLRPQANTGERRAGAMPDRAEEAPARPSAGLGARGGENSDKAAAKRLARAFFDDQAEEEEPEEGWAGAGGRTKAGQSGKGGEAGGRAGQQRRHGTGFESDPDGSGSGTDPEQDAFEASFIDDRGGSQVSDRPWTQRSSSPGSPGGRARGGAAQEPGEWRPNAGRMPLIAALLDAAEEGGIDVGGRARRAPKRRRAERDAEAATETRARVAAEQASRGACGPLLADSQPVSSSSDSSPAAPRGRGRPRLVPVPATGVELAAEPSRSRRRRSEALRAAALAELRELEAASAEEEADRRRRDARRRRRRPKARRAAAQAGSGLALSGAYAGGYASDASDSFIEDDLLSGSEEDAADGGATRDSEALSADEEEGEGGADDSEDGEDDEDEGPAPDRGTAGRGRGRASRAGMAGVKARPRCRAGHGRVAGVSESKRSCQSNSPHAAEPAIVPPSAPEPEPCAQGPAANQAGAQRDAASDVPSPGQGPAAGARSRPGPAVSGRTSAAAGEETSAGSLGNDAPSDDICSASHSSAMHGSAEASSAALGSTSVIDSALGSAALDGLARRQPVSPALPLRAALLRGAPPPSAQEPEGRGAGAGATGGVAASTPPALSASLSPINGDEAGLSEAQQHDARAGAPAGCDVAGPAGRAAARGLPGQSSAAASAMARAHAPAVKPFLPSPGRGGGGGDSRGARGGSEGHSRAVQGRARLFERVAQLTPATALAAAVESVAARLRIDDLQAMLPPDLVRRVPSLSVRDAAMLRARLRKLAPVRAMAKPS